MKRLTLVLILPVFCACTNQKKTDKVIDSAAAVVTQTGTDSLSYTYDSVKVYSKNKISANKLITDTAKAVIVYPVFTDPAVNKFITDRVTGSAGKEGMYKTYGEMAAGFIKEFDEFQAKNNSRNQTWFEDLNLSVKANYPDYLSVLYRYVDYKGGAHPNTLFTYLNYNPKNYQTITLDSIITSEGMPQLRAIAEQIFRKNEKLAPNANLADGYFFPGGVFALAETFTLSKEGILFLYNPYEIKPYVAGTTELTVPYSSIKDILKPSPVLANFK